MDNRQGNDDINQVLSKITNLAQSGQTNQAYADFIDKLIEQKGFPDLTPEVREELKKDLMRRLDDFIAARMIAALSDEDVVKFEELLKKGAPETEVQQFTSTHIPDFIGFITNVLLEFRGVYLGVLDAPVVIEQDAQSAGQQSDNESSSLPPAPLAPPPAPSYDKNVN